MGWPQARETRDPEEERGEARAHAVVSEVGQVAANDAPPETSLTVWDVFTALQDAADEMGCTPQEADRAVSRAYCCISRYVV